MGEEGKNEGERKVKMREHRRKNESKYERSGMGGERGKEGW